MYACYYLHIWSNYVSINNVLKSQISWCVKTTKLPRMTSIWFVSSKFLKEISNELKISPSTFIHNKLATFTFHFTLFQTFGKMIIFTVILEAWAVHPVWPTMITWLNEHLLFWFLEDFLNYALGLHYWIFSLPLHNIRPMPCWIYDASMQIFNLHKYIW